MQAKINLVADGKRRLLRYAKSICHKSMPATGYGFDSAQSQPMSLTISP